MANVCVSFVQVFFTAIRVGMAGINLFGNFACVVAGALEDYAVPRC